jgi:DNA-binding transcriptional ArsR family regulator
VHELLIIAEVACVVSMILAAQADAIVLDPVVLDEVARRQILDALMQVPLPIILYSTLTPAFAKLIVQFSKATTAEVVLKGFDDEAQQLRRLLATVAPPELPLHLGPLSEAIARLRPNLRLNVQALFTRSDSADSPTRLAAHSGMARRSLSRHLTDAGINSARLLIAGARIIRVYSRLSNPRISLREVAAMAGCGDLRSLDNQCYALVGRSAKEVRSALSREEFVSLFAERVCATSDRGGFRRGIRWGMSREHEHEVPLTSGRG